MEWIYLLIAGVLEVIWAVSMKSTAGFTRLWPTLGTVTTMIASVFFLALAARTIPLSTAYVMWTGIGAVGTWALSVLVLGEPFSPLRLVFILTILLAMVGLKFS